MAKKEKPKPVVEPYRQKVLAELLAGNIGKKKPKALYALMLEAGFSKSYAESPDKLKATASWQQLMDKHVSDKKLALRHSQLLDKKETFVEEDVDGKRKIVRSKEIHVGAVAKGLELGYRLKGRLTDKVGLDIKSTKVDEALARLRKIVPPMEIQEGEIVK